MDAPESQISVPTLDWYDSLQTKLSISFSGVTYYLKFFINNKAYNKWLKKYFYTLKNYTHYTLTAFSSKYNNCQEK